ncbi:hypothetical protein [Arenimonas sp. MALMAid1274]|uniref:hypothetical protein n=1 Tax=Arenimonas sp. MALMAid1274 TaxID=3411630 RepID=UPI003BA2297C
MRLVIAALLGGVMLFCWGFVSHMLLPTGNMGMGEASNEDVVLAALKQGLPAQAGVYMVPGLAPEQYEDTAAVAAYSAKAVAQPNAVIIYQPVGRDGMAMGPQLATEFGTCTLAALLAAWVMSLGNFSFGKRVTIATVMGLFAWLVISVPYWNWYRFPVQFTAGSLIMTGVGWFLAGLPMAWWLGRRRR